MPRHPSQAARVPLQVTTPRGLELTLLASATRPFQYDVRSKGDGRVLGQIAGYPDYGWREFRDGQPRGPVYLTPAEAADATDAMYADTGDSCPGVA